MAKESYTKPVVKGIFLGIAVFFTLLVLFARNPSAIGWVCCADSEENTENDADFGTYVPGYVTSSGKVVKGHVRKQISTSNNAYRNRLRSRTYYQNHKNYIRSKRNK